MTITQIGNPSVKKNRQVGLNTAYQESDTKLNTWFEENYPGSKVYIFHHSHLLSTKINNARRYNTKRINGICIAILVTPDLSLPQFAYSVCSKSDSYSRLIGRVEAKAALKTNLEDGLIAYPTSDLKQYPTVLSQFYRFINQVVLRVAPIYKPVKADKGVHPLTFAKEAELEILAKSTITSKFEGLLARNVQTIPIYIRRYNNCYFENMYGTHEYIRQMQEQNPNEDVQLDSTGGITGVAFLFDHEGKTYLAMSTALCHVNDHFDKAIGRKIAYKNFHDQVNFSITIVSDIKDRPLDVLKENLVTIFSSQYEVSANDYKGEI